VKLPDFFLAGAPKSGTTALSEYLREHPGVFFSNPKELNYFCEDFAEHRFIRTRADYEKQFMAAAPEQRVGEGSVVYLYSRVALANIRAFNPDAQIIIMLRNPLDMIPALHQQFLAALYEDEPSFERAWSLQEERAQGRHIPRLCREPELLAYRRIGLLGEQVERLWRVFPREQTLLILFDDFIADTAATYRQVLDFLGLEDDGRNEFPVVNEAHALRTGLAGRVVRSAPPALRNLITRMRYHPVTRALPALADRWLKQPQPRTELSGAFREGLKAAFREDVELLGQLLERDLPGLWGFDRI